MSTEPSNSTDAQRYLALAEEAGKLIADDEDRAIFTNDLTDALIGGNWHGLR